MVNVVKTEIKDTDIANGDFNVDVNISSAVHHTVYLKGVAIAGIGASISIQALCSPNKLDFFDLMVGESALVGNFTNKYEVTGTVFEVLRIAISRIGPATGEVSVIVMSYIEN